VLELADLGLELGQARLATLEDLGQALEGGLVPGGEVVGSRCGLLYALDRAAARHRLDPAHPGRDPALRGDHQQADVAGALHVTAAAQLAGEVAVANRDHPHRVAVLLAEQGHGAQAARLADRHHLLPDRLVADDRPVGQPLDLAQLLLGHRLAPAEVEAEPVGLDQ